MRKTIARVISLFVSAAIVFSAALFIGSANKAEAATNLYIIDDGASVGTLRIGNSKVEIALNRNTGYFKDISNKSLGYHYKVDNDTNSSFWPYALNVGTNGNQTQYFAAITYNCNQSMTWQDITGSATDRKVLQVTYGNLVDNATGTPLNVSLVYTLTVLNSPNDGGFNQNEYFTLKATITNNSPTLKVFGLYAANEGRLVADGTTGWVGNNVDGNRANEKLAIPDWNGGKIVSNPSVTSVNAYGFPGQNSSTLTMGWIDLYSSNKGIGMGYVNDGGMITMFRAGGYNGGSMMEWQQFDLIGMPSWGFMDDNGSYNTRHGLEGGGMSWTTGTWIIAPHSGDWHTMADTYRTVYYQNMKGNYTTSADYPSNFKDIWYEGEYTGYGVLNPGDPRQIFEPANNIVTDLQNSAKNIGTTPNHFLADIAGYNGNGGATTSGHEYGYPAFTTWGSPAGTATDVQNAVNGLNALGARTSIYELLYEDSPTADVVSPGSYMPNASNGCRIIEYSTNNFVPVLDDDTPDAQNMWANTHATWYSRGFQGVKFDTLPLVEGVTSNTNHVHVPNDTVGMLTAQSIGRRYIVDNAWNYNNGSWKPFLSGEMGNDISGGKVAYWGWNWGGDTLISQNNIFIRYTFPEKFVQSFEGADWKYGLARLQMPRFSDTTYNNDLATYQAYEKFREALSTNNAPGVPYFFKDNQGITSNNTGTAVNAFADPNNGGVTLTYYTPNSVNGSVTIDMRKLGYSVTSLVTAPITSNGTGFGFVIINSDGTIGTQWFGSSSTTVTTVTIPSGYTIVDDSDPSVTYTGSGWIIQNGVTNNYPGDSSDRYSGTAGDSASFTFNGTSITLYSRTNAWGGYADIYIDGNKVNTVSCYSSAEQLSVPLYSNTGLTNGMHTIKVVVNGAKGVSTGGSAIVIDAFVYGGGSGGGSGAAATNVALNKTATASSSVTGEEPALAVDGSLAPYGNGNSKWCSNTPGDKWLKVDLGQSYTISRWIVDHAQAGGESQSENTSDFKLQRSDDGTNWTDVDSVTGNTAAVTDRNVASFTARYVRLYITNGCPYDGVARIYEFGVYGIPASGGGSPVTVDDSDPSIVYTGSGWTVQNNVANDYTGDGSDRYSGTAGDSASLTFNGTSITLYSRTNQWGGTADIYIDGNKVNTVSCYAAAEQLAIPLYSNSSLASGTHTIKVVVTGISGVSGGGSGVNIDAFVYSDGTTASSGSGNNVTPVTIDDSNPSIVYTGSGWTVQNNVANDYTGDGSDRYSETAGDSASLTFNGTSITLYSRTNQWGGTADIYIDGSKVSTVSCYAAAEQLAIPLYSNSSLASGTHTIKVVVTGTSGVSGGGSGVNIDAFVYS